jgi:hypothetical protein
LKKLLLLCASTVFFSLGHAHQIDFLTDLEQQGKLTPQEARQIEDFTNLCNEKTDNNVPTFSQAETDTFWSLVDKLMSKN